MYTVSAMKYFQKTIVLGLIVILTSFAGDFCMHTVAQASDVPLVMPTLHDGDMQMSGNDAPLAISTCVFDCINKTPQATVAKKTTVNSALSLSLAIFQTESPDPVFISDTFGAVGTHPPSPDILSSIMKRE